MTKEEFKTHLFLLGFKQVPCASTENYKRVEFSNGKYQVLIDTMPTSSMDYLNIYIFNVDRCTDPMNNFKEALSKLLSILKSRNTK